MNTQITDALPAIKQIVSKFKWLKIVSDSTEFIKIENNKTEWNSKFESEVKRILVDHNLQMMYSTSFGGCDYFITKNGSL